MTELELTEDLVARLVTETVAILGRRGGGKSNAAVVLAEEMDRLGQQWVAIDPKGDWWGIRSDTAGTGPGLSVPVFGGAHGDLLLEASAGALMAQLVIERDLTCLLDVSDFSKRDQVHFVTDFAEHLFRLIRRDPRPLHLFLEEAEEFLPQRFTSKDGAPRMVGAYSKISKQGRSFGLGVTLVTQRSASLNKDALSQTGTLVLFRTTSPHDRRAVVAWAEHEDRVADVAESLATLQPGESWVLSPDALGELRRVQWRRRSTFDSGATPEVGVVRRRDPIRLADIDLGEISDLMAEAVQRAEADDPRSLRARIAQLEHQLANQPAAEPTIVEVPVVPPELWLELAELGGAIKQAALATIADVDTLLDHARDADQAPPARTRFGTAAPRPAAPTTGPSGYATLTEAHETGNPPTDSPKLGKAEREILSVLAQHAQTGRTPIQIAILTGRSSKGGGFKNALSSLRSSGLIDRGDPIRITTAGLEAIAGQYEPLPTGGALVDYWVDRLGRAEGLILRHLVTIAPSSATRDEVAGATGYEPNGGGFKNALSRLRTLQLIEGRNDLRASDQLGSD